MDAPHTPVTIVSGFLGAGKTTLLNELLAQSPGQRIAVIENEYGEIGIDGELVIGATEDVTVLSNGCVCCTVRGDLVRVLREWRDRRLQVDRIVLETTGLADPGPVIRTFFLEPSTREWLALDGVVTMVDASHVIDQTNKFTEAREQIAHADRLIINKIDLVTPDDLDRVEQHLKKTNPVAQMRRALRGAVPVDFAFAIGGFNLRLSVETNASFYAVGHDPDGGVGRHSSSNIQAVALQIVGEISRARLYRWVGDLLALMGRDIFRMKGILAIDGVPVRMVFQGVHELIDCREGAPWSNAPRLNRIVFIGRNLDHDELEQGLTDCFVRLPSRA